MTTESTFKIISKFLKPNEADPNKLKNIKDILKLPIIAYKFLEDKDVKIFKDNFKIAKIDDAAKLNKVNPFNSLIDLKAIKDTEKKNELIEEKIEEFKENYPDFEEKLIKVATISSLIKSIKDEEIIEKRSEQKIVVVGLDNAGKTAILSRFGKKMGIVDLAKLKPTIGIDRRNIRSDTLDLYIWDFGGQKKFRERYFDTPEKYFIHLDLLIYVIDIQDSERFDESFEYFEKIIETIIALEESPYFIVFLHKYDPDIKSKPEILLNVEFLKENLREVLEKIDYQLDYEIYLTSIYSLISNEPKFSKYIKDVLKSPALTNPTLRKVEGLGDILEETMNAVIKLSESISIQLNTLEQRITALESQGFLAAQSGIPIEIQNPEQIGVKENQRVNTRSMVLDELKDLFAKKKGLDL